jgi:Protein of unknown function (DUF4019)
MQSIIKYGIAIFVISLLTLGNFLQAATDRSLFDAERASQDWLQLVDKERYGDSWDASSQLFKDTMTRGEWESIIAKLRRPLGTVNSRSTLDQKKTKILEGLPEGEYVEMLYNTSFSNRPLAYEMLILVLEKDKQWRVVTYQVD